MCMIKMCFYKMRSYCLVGCLIETVGSVRDLAGNGLVSRSEGSNNVRYGGNAALWPMHVLNIANLRFVINV